MKPNTKTKLRVFLDKPNKSNRTASYEINSESCLNSTDGECDTMEDSAPINDLDSSSLIRTERKWLRELSAFARGSRSSESSNPPTIDSKKLGVFQVRITHTH